MHSEYDNVQANGRFLQIKSHEDHREFESLDIWTTIVPAKQSQTVINKIKSKLPPQAQPISLNHIRRIVKDKLEDGVQYTRVVIGPVETMPEVSSAEALMAAADITDAVVERRQCSKYPGRTKEQTSAWAEQSGWPMIWRGNVDAIPTVLEDAEADEAVKYLNEAAKLGQNNQGGLPVACIIVDPSKNAVVISKSDQRHCSNNPLNHCVMDAIHEVAKQEQDRRSSVSFDERTYLCLNMHVYLTHEPCVMCAMALNHSRISRLFYIQSSPATGGIEPNSAGGHCVHWNKNLNWSYEAWKCLANVEDPGECTANA